MTELCDLATKYGTNKAEIGYTPIYHSLFGTRKYSTRRVLEVGIGGPGLSGGPSKHAASLYMWREYFPEAEIVGLDNRSELLFRDDRILTYWCDVFQPGTVQDAALAANRDVFEKYDVMIDDAVHEPRPQIDTMLMLLPLLSRDGYYCVEDVANCSPSEIINEVPDGYVGTSYDWGHHCKLVVVQRNVNLKHSGL